MTSETAFSDHEFALLSRLVQQSCGINLTPQKKDMLRMRIAKRMRLMGQKSFLAYYRLVRSDRQELTEMIDAVATNVTHFFREEHHFRFLRRALPALAQQHGELRIWSAGCASGEEPYSIAIVLDELFGASGGSGRPGGRILATDISTRILHQAEQGIYLRHAVEERMPTSLMQQAFQLGVAAQEGQVRIKEPLRRLVRFARLNLLDETYPFARKFHVIFCRNVMIYFDQETKMKLLSRFHRHLADDGYLIIGHAETVLNRNDFIPADLTVFRKA